MRAHRSSILLMGILNVTPNSFSDGGKFLSVDAAVAQAGVMLQEGADYIDVGGESTGPGSADVSIEEELARVIPVIQGIKKKWPKARISIDTYKARVAFEAIKAGAVMVNDVTALRGDPALAGVVAKARVPIILMYAKDETARTTRVKKRYADVVKTVGDFLKARIQVALQAGIRREKILIDPGMGAFVSGEPKYSFEILRRLGELRKLGVPILVGTSRKSFLGGTLEERLIPSVVTACMAAQNGATILRVHDVGAHKKMLETWRKW